MPSSAEHRDKYEANRRLLNAGNNGTPLSTLDGCWAVIVAFSPHFISSIGSPPGPIIIQAITASA